MLVLSRKENERIMISRDIVITVVGIRGPRQQGSPWD
ncbi:MAG TPA: carbon storage regulator [Thermoguttaceae bacterium]|nr:carbon storage regulator [Thermoguttaceae bacterium]